MTVRSSISLTVDQIAFAKALLDSERYSSFSVDLGHVISLLQQRLEIGDLQRRALHEVLFRRRSGEFVESEEMDNRLARLIVDKRRVHGILP